MTVYLLSNPMLPNHGGSETPLVYRSLRFVGKARGIQIMNADEQKRYELEHLWKMRVEEAKARLDIAAELVEELHQDLGTIHQPDPDNHDNAICICVYTGALEEFTKISKIYHDLVLHGAIPDEEETFSVRAMNAG